MIKVKVRKNYEADISTKKYSKKTQARLPQEERHGWGKKSIVQPKEKRA